MKSTLARTRTHVCTNTDILRESVLNLVAAKSPRQETLHPLLSWDTSHMTFKGRCGLEGETLHCALLCTCVSGLRKQNGSAKLS